MDRIEQEVWATVQAMNRCWTCGDERELAKLGQYFHTRMVAVTPADRFRLEGRESCIAGWSQFAASVTIRQWQEKEALVQVYGKAAVVVYYYELAGKIDGAPVTLAGRDMLALVLEDGRWQVVADQFSPYPRNEEGAQP